MWWWGYSTQLLHYGMLSRLRCSTHSKAHYACLIRGAFWKEGAMYSAGFTFANWPLNEVTITWLYYIYKKSHTNLTCLLFPIPVICDEDQCGPESTFVHIVLGIYLLIGNVVLLNMLIAIFKWVLKSYKLVTSSLQFCYILEITSISDLTFR